MADKDPVKRDDELVSKHQGDPEGFLKALEKQAKQKPKGGKKR